jgi:hypothetical protein
MVVGDDQAVLRDEEAGTEGARLTGARRFLFLLLAALLEEILKTRHAAELFEERDAKLIALKKAMRQIGFMAGRGMKANDA